MSCLFFANFFHPSKETTFSTKRISHHILGLSTLRTTFGEIKRSRLSQKYIAKIFCSYSILVLQKSFFFNFRSLSATLNLLVHTNDTQHKPELTTESKT